MQPLIAAVTIAIKDIDVLKEFYTDKFGWQIIAENEKVVMLKLDNLVLTLCDGALFKEYTNITNNTQSKAVYFTINLASKANVDEQIAKLNQAGVQILKQPSDTFWGGYAAFVADPEGNCWEICYNPYTENR